MRVNASSVLEADQGLASEKLAQKGLDQGVAEEYARGLAASPDSLPKGAQERDCDALLAEICVRLSAERHAGFRDAVYTVDGKRQIQKGKDLRSVRRLVGTGGYLSRLSTPEILEEACYRRLSTDGRERLLPVRPRLFKDPNHLFPLIANLAATCPEEAVQLAADQIEELSRTSKRADTR